MRRIVAVVATACLLGGWTSVSAKGTQSSSPPDTTAVETDAVYGGELVQGMATAPESLAPAELFASYAKNIALQIYDTLLVMNTSGELQPNLASDFSSPDGGQTWVITLRPDVTFSDGTPFDAAAVVASTEVLVDPANNCPCLSKLAALESVEATGELEVTYHLTTPSASFIAQLADSLGMIAAAGSTADLPIGAGPFTLDEAVDGDTYRLVRNETYWQSGLPYLDSVVYRVIPDIQTQLASVETGEVDITVTIANSLIPQIETNENLVRVQYGGFGNVMLVFQNQTAPFDDVRARRAVTMALDLATYHEAFNNGAVQPATSAYSRTSWAYPGEIAAYPSYDLAGAQALVEELDGLSFTLIVPAYYYEQVVPLHAMLLAAGMDVELQQGENRAIIDQYRAGDYQAVFTGYSGGSDPQDFTQSYLTDGFVNTSRYSDPEMDALIAEADAVVDQAARAAVYKQIAEKAAADIPFAIINNYNDSFVTSASVQGIVPVPDGSIPLVAVWLAD